MRTSSYKPRTTLGALGYLGAAWLDLFAAIYDAFPFDTTKTYARYLRVRASATRRDVYYEENPDADV